MKVSVCPQVARSWKRSCGNLMILRHRVNRECERARAASPGAESARKEQKCLLSQRLGVAGGCWCSNSLVARRLHGRKMTVLPLISLSTGKSDCAATARLRPRARKRVSIRLCAPKRYRHRGYTTVRLQYVCVVPGPWDGICRLQSGNYTTDEDDRRVNSCTRRDPGGRSKRGPSCTVRSFYPRYLTLTPPLTINCQTSTGMKLLSAPAATDAGSAGHAEHHVPHLTSTCVPSASPRGSKVVILMPCRPIRSICSGW